MKVVQTSKGYAPMVGGMEVTVTNLSEGLCAKQGVEVEVLVCNYERSLVVQRKLVNGVSVTLAPSWGVVSSLPLSPTYFRLLSSMRGDILHIHEPFPLAPLSVLASSTIRNHFSRIVVSWHSDIIRQQWILGAYRPLIHRFLRMVDRIFVSTPNLIEHSEYLPMYRDQCEVIPHGVKLDWVRTSNARGRRVAEIRHEYGSPLILFVGRLVYYKGLEYLIESMAQLMKTHLVIIGSGPLRSNLMDQIARLGLNERISILPPVPEDELHAFYEACDIFVLPSTEKSETYGLVQIEAMASGKPVVSTKLQTGVTFVNLDGVTGITVAPRDVRALAAAINRLLTNESLRVSLGKQAQARALREFSAETMVDKTLEAYERVLRS